MKLISARDSRAPAPLSTVKRAPAILRGALEVDDAERRARGPSAACGSKSNARGSPCAAHLDVVRRALADRHAGVRQVRQRRAAPRRADARSSRAACPSCLICCARARFASWTRRGVLALALRRAISSPDVFCWRFRPSSSRNQPPARGLERRDLFERLVGIEPAVAQAGAHLFDVIANEAGSSMLPRPSILYRVSRILCYDSVVTATVRKAVFPAAGLGTRFLPGHQGAAEGNAAARRQADHPVRRRGGGRVGHRQHHPRHRPRQERDRGSLRRLGRARDRFSKRAASASSSTRSARSPNMINFAYVRQGEPLGLGHAVLVTRELVGDEPFAVILGDDVIDADPPAIKQLIDVFDRVGRSGARRRARAARGDLELRRHRASSRAPISATASIRCAIWWRSRRARRRRRTSRSSAATC